MSDLVTIAEKYIGCRQYGSGHRSIIDIYNTSKNLPRGYRVSYNDNWCATFVSSILIIAGVRGYKECSANRLRKQMEKHQVSKGKRNDIIFYDWNGDTWSDHVGIIVSVDEKDGIYKVIEGNKNKSVEYRNIKCNSSNIQGIYRIYETEEKTENKKKNNVNNGKRISKKLITDIVAGKYGNGNTRRKKIEALGYDYEKVQKKVNEYLKG